MDSIGLLAQLRTQANQIAEEGHNGWGNTMIAAADRIAELEEDRLRFYHADGTFEILTSPEEVMKRRVGCAIQIKDLKHALLVCHADANRALLSGIRGDYQDALLTIRLTADNAIG